MNVDPMWLLILGGGALVLIVVWSIVRAVLRARARRRAEEAQLAVLLGQALALNSKREPQQATSAPEMEPGMEPETEAGA